MKYLKITFFFLILFTCNIANAETYYVNTPVLNLRSCEGTNCKILGKLTSGEKVDILEDKGEWVKVQTNRGEGFVIKRSLAVQNSDISTGDGIMGILLFIFLGCIAIILYFLPSFIAKNNANHNKVFWVNLLIGWIPIIWLILLIAALVGEKKKKDIV